MKIYRNFLKRLFDLLASGAGLIIALPAIIVIWVVLFIANSGKPLFYQVRPGKNTRLFKIIKFRTMNNRKDANGNLLSDRQRLTRAGNIIRKTSLDELPQLINVLKGDMSLVGPRPLLVRYLPFYTVEEQLRHSVRPGITGLAQINGRNNLTWEKRLGYDVQYARNLSFFLDMKIIFLTVKKVFLSKDIIVIPGEKMKNLDDERSS